jgi:hypothetical protein
VGATGHDPVPGGDQLRALRGLRKFADAVRNADGELVADARIPHEIVEAALADLAANPE